MTVLVTGGAGYSGSHTVYALIDRGERVVVLDNLSTGLRALVSSDAVFVRGDAGDQALVRRIIREYNVDSVIHFAGSAIVPESIAQPLQYYANNTAGSFALIEACIFEGVDHFIFSSSAAVYGSPTANTVTEETPTNPISPYGRSKLMTEWMLQDVSNVHTNFRYIALRYFNVAGADPLGRTGQSTPNATHLIKRACQVALGRVSHLDIFGTDYPTSDGTGVRDYIHVSDLANAHLLALDALREGARSSFYNCGYGKGFSVRQIIACLEEMAGIDLSVKECVRRPGDPPILISDATRLKTSLNWKPATADLHTIIHSALQWEKQLKPISLSPA